MKAVVPFLLTIVSALAPAFAAPVTYQWSTAVGSVAQREIGAFQAGSLLEPFDSFDQFSGTLTYDPDAVGTLIPGGVTFTGTSITSTLPALPDPTFRNDLLGATAANSVPFESITFNHWVSANEFVLLRLRRTPPDGMFFDGVNLPGTLDLSVINVAQFEFIQLLAPGGGLSLRRTFTINELALVAASDPIPLPAAAIIFPAGFALLGLAKKTRSKAA